MVKGSFTYLPIGRDFEFYAEIFGKITTEREILCRSRIERGRSCEKLIRSRLLPELWYRRVGIDSIPNSLL